jgi:hypothetical protein
VVTYVNTTAEVKAESDICCTSGNAVRVLESLGTDRVIMIPDQYLAWNMAAQTGIDVITWPGACEVHERFTPREIHQLRDENPGVVVLAHPECPPDVVAAADHSGSTAQMSQFVVERRPQTIALITECSMSDNLAVAHPDVRFVRPCNLCPHMKRNSLAKIRASLELGITEVTVDPVVAARAREAVERPAVEHERHAEQPDRDAERGERPGEQRRHSSTFVARRMSTNATDQSANVNASAARPAADVAISRITPGDSRLSPMIVATPMPTTM